MKKKFLAWLLTVAMVFNIALPYTAFAEDMLIDTDSSYSASETETDNDATDEVDGDTPTADVPTTADEPAADGDNDAESDGKEVDQPAAAVPMMATLGADEPMTVADGANTAPTLAQESFTAYIKVNKQYSRTTSVIKKYFVDADNDTLTYYYKDETHTDWTVASTTLRYKYAEVGTHYIYLKANDGTADSPILTITLNVVENTPPKVKADAPTTVSVAPGVTLSLSMDAIFEDTDIKYNGDSTVEKLTYKVYVDDSSEATTVRDNYANVWYDFKPHTLKFVAQDNSKATVEHTVTVNMSTEGLDADTWTGAVDYRWYNATGTEFTLSKPAQLAALPYIVNGLLADGGIAADTFEGKTIKLAADMKLNDVLFTYHPDVARVEITQGETTVYYAPNTLTGRADNAPNNKEATFYTTKTGTDTVSASNTGLVIKEWLPIGNGTLAKVFKGTLDGQNHKIIGLYRNDVSRNSKDDNVGLFASLNGTVKNLTIDGFFTATMNGSVNIGGMAAKVFGGEIANCTNDVMILSASKQPGQNSGGLIGHLSAMSDFSVQKLINNAPVQSEGNVGGIVGYVTKNGSDMCDVTIADCKNTGLIDYGGWSLTAGQIGGIVGSVYGNNVTIEKAVNNGAVGSVLMDTGKNGYAYGGIIGVATMAEQSGASGTEYSSFKLTDSYNMAAVRGVKYVGGIIGEVQFKENAPADDVVIKSCYNAGKLTCTAVLADNYGGVIGNGSIYDATIDKLYYTTEAYSGITSTSAKTPVGLQKVGAADMKAADFVTKLGEAFVPDKGNTNFGYPILADEDMGSSAKDITGFAINGVNATIDNAAKTVAFDTPFDMVVSGNTCEFTPTVQVSDKASVTPTGKATFKQNSDDNTKYSCEYFVTAENGSVRVYSVVVSTAAAVSNITLDKTSIELVAGFGTEALTAVISPANASNCAVNWQSSNEGVATVDADGVVTGVAEGEAVITATTVDGGKKAECRVKVTPFVSVTEVSLPETAEVIRNEEITLTVTVLPTNASNKAVTWQSADAAIATVDDNGKVKGIKEGTVDITVTSADGGKTATCAVTVKKIDVTKVEVNQTKYLAVGKSKQLLATVSPANATEQGVEWSSSNTGVATVDVTTGVVKGIAAGEVTITAKSRDNSEIVGTVTLTVLDDYGYEVGWKGTFNANADNNNIAPGKLIGDDQIAVEEWSASVGNSTVAVVGDYVYAYACAYGMDGFQMGGEKQTFYKIDKATGEIVDKISGCPGSGGYYYGYTIYGDGMIYVACPGTVMAFDIDSFKMVWSATVGNANYVPIQYVNGYVVSNGCVLNAATGAVQANLNGSYGKYNYASGVVVDNKYIVAGYDGYLHSFDTTNWQEVGKVQFASDYGETSGYDIKKQPGVLHHKGSLYWDGIEMSTSKPYLYYMKLGSNGSLGTVNKVEVGGMNVVTPVAYGNRLYLAGQPDAVGGGSIAVYDLTDMSLIYTATAPGKFTSIQSTPILYADTENNAVYLYAQTYDGSHIYYLKDTPDATSGSMKWLVTPSARQYAFEQLSCDDEGALYITNDSGNLFKIIGVNGVYPEITTDLSDEPVTYTKGAKANALNVVATVNEADATIKYQWQSSENDVDTEYANIEGATGGSYTPDVSKTGTTFYRCKVTNSKDERVYVMSTAAQIRVESSNSSGGSGAPAEKTVAVTVNFSKDGELVVHNAALNVRDTDNDKKYTMNDAFVVLHEKYDDAANYEGSSTGWVTKFWGDTSMNLGYTQNHKWVWGANQVINSGDKLDVFIYQDTGADYSDLLTWFDKESYSGKTGNEITFSVKGMYLFGSGEGNKQAAAVPVGATVAISKDGSEIATAQTDENGQFKLSFPDAGLYTIDVGGTCSYTCDNYNGGKISNDNAPVVPCRCTVSISGNSTGGSIGGGAAVDTKYTAADVKDLIDKIGTVTKDSKSAIEKAREAYDSLTAAQKKNVTNYDKLTAAEKAYTELTGEKIDTAKLPFTDVAKDSWYYDAIKAMYDKGLMNGESATKFMPNNKLSRAMLVTILYRMQNEPTVTANALFNDVADGQWYTKAVAWASANNVVNGVGDGKFAPNDSVTRQEMAAMLYRYAKATGMDTTATASLSNFKDSAKVADWATDAMKWAVGSGLMKGNDDNTINPMGTATRAEVATVIVRLLSK